MRCVRCNKTLTDEEAFHQDKEKHFMDTCFTCLYGDSIGEDDSQDDDEWWGNVWPDQE